MVLGNFVHSNNLFKWLIHSVGSEYTLLNPIEIKRREFLSRTEPYRQSKLYVNCQSPLTIVVLTVLSLSGKFALFDYFWTVEQKYPCHL